MLSRGRTFKQMENKLRKPFPIFQDDQCILYLVNMGKQILQLKMETIEFLYIYIYISGGPLSALTCCVNVRLLSAIKKISPLIYSQSWVGSWVYTTQAMMTFTLIF